MLLRALAEKFPLTPSYLKDVAARRGIKISKPYGVASLAIKQGHAENLIKCAMDFEGEIRETRAQLKQIEGELEGTRNPEERARKYAELAGLQRWCARVTDQAKMAMFLKNPARYTKMFPDETEIAMRRIADEFEGRGHRGRPKSH